MKCEQNQKKESYYKDDFWIGVQTAFSDPLVLHSSVTLQRDCWGCFPRSWCTVPPHIRGQVWPLLLPPLITKTPGALSWHSEHSGPLTLRVQVRLEVGFLFVNLRHGDSHNAGYDILVWSSSPSLLNWLDAWPSPLTPALFLKLSPSVLIAMNWIKQQYVQGSILSNHYRALHIPGRSMTLPLTANTSP